MKELHNKNAVIKIIQTACERLKNTVSPSSYKDYLLTLFFLKAINSLWERRYSILKDQYGDNSTLIDEMIRTERFQIPEEARFSYLYSHRNEQGNSERFDLALQLLMEANINKFSNFFQHISFNAKELGVDKYKNELLAQLLDDIEKIDIDFDSEQSSTSSDIGVIFEIIIQYFASSAGKSDQEFYTPPEVSSLIAQLVDPQEADSIYDPACGSASLMLECVNEIHKNHTGSMRYSIFGQEISNSNWAMAKMNMFLHNEENHFIEWGDTIRNPKLLEYESSLKQFDIVVSHPPFSLTNWGYEVVSDDKFGRFNDYFLPPKTRGDYAFILHMLSSLEPKHGRMAVIAPHGVLFRASSEAEIRQKLIKDNKVDAVIGLPEKLFNSSNIATAIIIFKMDKIDNNILFIDASECFTPISRTQNQLKEEHVQKIVEVYKKRKTVENFSYLASFDELNENNFNCNISKYVKKIIKQETIDLNSLRKERENLQIQLLESGSKITNIMDKLGYGA